MDQNEIYIEEATEFSSEVAVAVRHLVKQLDNNFQPLTDEDVRSIVGSTHTHLYLARFKNNRKIIGMVTLVMYRIPYKVKAQLEDIVVDFSVRGQGIGRKLMEFAIDNAKELGVKSLNFTSSPNRESANKLYESLGFKKRDTNIYQLSL